jgi:hypothetical protein
MIAESKSFTVEEANSLKTRVEKLRGDLVVLLEDGANLVKLYSVESLEELCANLLLGDLPKIIAVFPKNAVISENFDLNEYRSNLLLIQNDGDTIIGTANVSSKYWEVRSLQQDCVILDARRLESARVLNFLEVCRVARIFSSSLKAEQEILFLNNLESYIRVSLEDLGLSWAKFVEQYEIK